MIYIRIYFVNKLLSENICINIGFYTIALLVGFRIEKR